MNAAMRQPAAGGLLKRGYVRSGDHGAADPPTGIEERNRAQDQRHHVPVNKYQVHHLGRYGSARGGRYLAGQLLGLHLHAIAEHPPGDSRVAR